MCLPASEQQWYELVRWLAPIAVPAISGLVGVIIGALLNSGRERKQRKLAFLEKQLSAFYSPMLGCRNEIKTHSAFRVHVQDQANAAWEQLCSESEGLSVEALQRITQERGPEFKRIITYDNNKFHEELLPAYRKMVEIFRECYWLAEPETRAFYGELLEFVEVWNRWIDKALPAEVMKRLDHGENKLIPFYEHIEKTHDAIRQKLKVGEP